MTKQPIHTTWVSDQKTFPHWFFEQDIIFDIRPVCTDYQNLEQLFGSQNKQYQRLEALSGWGSRHLDQAGQWLDRNVDISWYRHARTERRYIKVVSTSGMSWEARRNYDYQWYMTTDEFRSGIEYLVEAANFGVVCLLGEGLTRWCIRGQIADYLCLLGYEVFHLPDYDNHRRQLAERLSKYDKAVLEVWKNHGAAVS